MASKETLQAIHDGLAEWCLGVLAAKDPETNAPVLTAAEATVVRAFLKDNDVTAPPVAGGKVQELREKLAARMRSTPIDPALDGLGDGILQ